MPSAILNAIGAGETDKTNSAEYDGVQIVAASAFSNRCSYRILLPHTNLAHIWNFGPKNSNLMCIHSHISTIHIRAIQFGECFFAFIVYSKCYCVRRSFQFFFCSFFLLFSRLKAWISHAFFYISANRAGDIAWCSFQYFRSCQNAGCRNSHHSNIYSTQNENRTYTYIKYKLFMNRCCWMCLHLYWIRSVWKEVDWKVFK